MTTLSLLDLKIPINTVPNKDNRKSPEKTKSPDKITPVIQERLTPLKRKAEFLDEPLLNPKKTLPETFEIPNPSVLTERFSSIQKVFVRLVFPDQSEYKGDLVFGEPCGEGELIDIQRKIIYRGAFQGGLFHGKGKLTDLDGKLLFTGEFKEGKSYNGAGILDFLDGRIYEGTVINGLPDGSGKLTDHTLKQVYDGGFKNGEPDIYGTLTLMDGTPIFEGNFKEGKRHGIGMLLIDKELKLVYEGSFENDKFHGYGKISLSGTTMLKTKFEDGKVPNKKFDDNPHYDYMARRFEGEFKDGIPSGILIEVNPFGGVFKLHYENGELIKAEKIKTDFPI